MKRYEIEMVNYLNKEMDIEDSEVIYDFDNYDEAIEKFNELKNNDWYASYRNKVDIMSGIILSEHLGDEFNFIDEYNYKVYKNEYFDNSHDTIVCMVDDIADDVADEYDLNNDFYGDCYNDEIKHLMNKAEFTKTKEEFEEKMEEIKNILISYAISSDEERSKK